MCVILIWNKTDVLHCTSGTVVFLVCNRSWLSCSSLHFRHIFASYIFYHIQLVWASHVQQCKNKMHTQKKSWNKDKMRIMAQRREVHDFKKMSLFQYFLFYHMQLKQHIPAADGSKSLCEVLLLLNMATPQAEKVSIPLTRCWMDKSSENVLHSVVLASS